MTQPQILRIIVASSGDVQAERDCLEAVAKELNRDIAADRGLRLEVARWETDAFPGFHPEGPQGLIDSVLRIEDCDLLIGIFWKRFGRTAGDAGSGAEQEFRSAYEAWKRGGRPQIMVYFNQKAYAPQSKEETDPWGQVLEFKRTFPKEGLWWPYNGKAQFERLVRGHLTQWIRQQSASVPAGEGKAAVWNPREHATPPPAPGLCFGRHALVEALVATLLADNPPPALILGPAGIGKSTLTRQALHDRRVRERYGWRRFFVRCETVHTREALAAESARIAGLEAGPDAEQRLLGALDGERAVLVLDNLETPLEGDAAGTEAFLLNLVALDSLALVASVRGHRRPGEVAWRDPIAVEPLDPDPARETFLANAGQQYAGDPLLDGLLAAVERVPVAVTLLAKQVQGDPDLSDLRRRWDEERTRMLRHGGGDHRLNNIELSFELSIGSRWMTPEARRLLCLLALLPGGIARSDVRALLPENAGPAQSTLNQLGLTEVSGDRLRMLTPLREYVARAHPPEADDRDRLTGHYLELAQAWGWKVGTVEGGEAMRRLTPEIANIEEVILRALEDALPSRAISAAFAMPMFTASTGLGGTRALDRAVEAAQSSGDSLGQANCLFGLGYIALARSEHETARQRYEQAMLLYEQAGDLLGQANCIKSLGDVALERSEHETARRRYEQAMHLFEQVGKVLGQANCIQRLGDIALARSEHETARERYEQAMLLYERVGNVLGQANCIRSLGDIALERSEHETARAKFQEALSMYARIPEPYSIGCAHYRLAEVAPDDVTRQGHLNAARDAWNSIGRADLVERHLDA